MKKMKKLILLENRDKFLPFVNERTSTGRLSELVNNGDIESLARLTTERSPNKKQKLKKIFS